jgi:hypothetical protein
MGGWEARMIFKGLKLIAWAIALRSCNRALTLSEIEAFLEKNEG